MLLKPEITNELGMKQWNYIISCVGEDVAFDALSRLNGRRPFPLNVAKLLKIEFPQILLTKPKRSLKTKDMTIEERLNDRSWAYDDDVFPRGHTCSRGFEV